MKYTELPEDVLGTLAVNAGIITTSFTPGATATVTRADIIGATTGGVQISCVPNYSDMGEDIDNCPKNTKELKMLDSWECKMSGNMLSVGADNIKRFLGAGTIATEKITPNADLKQTDFETLWYVCDYGDTDGGYVAVKLINSLSTGGFSLQSTDKAKGQFAFEFTGHSSTEDINTIPMEFYVHAGA